MADTVVIPRPANLTGTNREFTEPSSQRYHALDFVRAASMLLGVFYHLQFTDTTSFGMFGFGGMGGGNPKAPADAWNHAFRMPLFFLISGFFANMMLAKYGFWKYLRRRWWRIGAPLVVSWVVFGLLRTYFPGVTSSALEGMSPPTTGAAAFGPFGGASNAFNWPNPTFTNSASQTSQTSNMAGNSQAVTNSTYLSNNAANPFAAGNPFAGGGQMAPGFFGPMPGTFGGPTQFTMPDPTLSTPGFAGPKVISHSCADAIFNGLNKAQDWVFSKAPWLLTALTTVGGQKGQLTSTKFSFEHLWFLWYLLVYVTIAPLLLAPLGRLLKTPASVLDKIGRWLLRFNLAVVVLALAAIPISMHADPGNWTVGISAGFRGSFPDCLWQYNYGDMPVYFLYFIAGWWFYRLREELPSVARFWLWNLTLGVVACALSLSVHTHHGLQAGAPHFAQYRLAAFALYTLAATCTGMGLIGFFQRYLDRPTRIAKYFTETMLWVYLVQLAIIPHVTPLLQSDRMPWWEATLAGVVVVTVIALVLYELIIRPTPLVRIFGPASMTRPRETTKRIVRVPAPQPA